MTARSRFGRASGMWSRRRGWLTHREIVMLEVALQEIDSPMDGAERDMES